MKSEAADIPEDLRKLYDYIMNGTISNELTKKIDDTVKRSRRNEEWRSEYMKELSHDDDIREEGRELGRAEGIRLFIQDKLEDGIAEDIILSKLMKIYSLTKKDAERHLKTFHK